jgi:hypothetical protein
MGAEIEIPKVLAPLTPVSTSPLLDDHRNRSGKRLSAIQALDRLDPLLPQSPGRAERHGFEYYRVDRQKDAHSPDFYLHYTFELTENFGAAFVRIQTFTTTHNKHKALQLLGPSPQPHTPPPPSL